METNDAAMGTTLEAWLYIAALWVAVGWAAVVAVIVIRNGVAAPSWPYSHGGLYP